MPEPTRYLHRLSGKVAIVTGAGAEGDEISIGRAIAYLFARRVQKSCVPTSMKAGRRPPSH